MPSSTTSSSPSSDFLMPSTTSTSRYNPIVSTYTKDSLGNIKFTLPSGSRGWKNMNSGEWRIEDCSGYTISQDYNGKIHIHTHPTSEGNAIKKITKHSKISKNGTFQFNHPDKPNNKSWIINQVKFEFDLHKKYKYRYSIFLYQDSEGQFVHIDRFGKIIFQDLYVEQTNEQRGGTELEGKRYDLSHFNAFDETSNIKDLPAIKDHHESHETMEKSVSNDYSSKSHVEHGFRSSLSVRIKNSLCSATCIPKPPSGEAH